MGTPNLLLLVVVLRFAVLYWFIAFLRCDSSTMFIHCLQNLADSEILIGSAGLVLLRVFSFYKSSHGARFQTIEAAAVEASLLILLLLLGDDGLRPRRRRKSHG